MLTAAPAPRGDRRVILALALGFGLVGIDRFLIVTMYPVIAKDLGLGYGAIGTITGALAFAWGAAALFMGNVADRIGRRLVLTGSLVVFSLLIGASGLAHSLMGLLVVRVAMGMADGAYTPASIAATIAASPPGREGRNVGIQQTMLPLFGLGIAPLLVAELLHVIDWRWIFILVTPPGLLLAWWMWRVIPPHDARAHPGTLQAHGHGGSIADWREALSQRDIPVAMLLMLCWLTCLITTSALLPSYLIDHLHLPFTAMGRVMSAIGIGAIAGTLVLAALSDVIGRKPVLILASVGTIGSLLGFAATGAETGMLFLWLFGVHFFNNAAITLTIGPICAEAVRPGLIATASGLVIASGEIFGGGLAPVIGGMIAERYGIEHILLLPIGAVSLGLLASLLLRSPRPRVPATKVAA